MKKELIRLHVNGELREAVVEPNKQLLDVLREDLGLTGTKRGCDDSSCGACTVLVGGEPQLSCIMLAVSYQIAEPSGPLREGGALPSQAGCEITTIEGIAREGELDPLQIGFGNEGGAQCGYCTPGMILTAKAFLAKHPHASDDELREALSGNLCRCTGYTQILASIRRAIELLRGSGALGAPAEPLPAEPAQPRARSCDQAAARAKAGEQSPSPLVRTEEAHWT